MKNDTSLPFSFSAMYSSLFPSGESSNEPKCAAEEAGEKDAFRERERERERG